MFCAVSDVACVTDCGKDFQYFVFSPIFHLAVFSEKAPVLRKVLVSMGCRWQLRREEARRTTWKGRWCPRGSFLGDLGRVLLGWRVTEPARMRWSGEAAMSLSEDTHVQVLADPDRTAGCPVQVRALQHLLWAVPTFIFSEALPDFSLRFLMSKNNLEYPFELLCPEQFKSLITKGPSPHLRGCLSLIRGSIFSWHFWIGKFWA